MQNYIIIVDIIARETIAASRMGEIEASPVGYDFHQAEIFADAPFAGEAGFTLPEFGM